MVTIHSCRVFSLIRGSTPQMHPGALARYSVERASAVFRYDGFYIISVVSCNRLTNLPVQILSGAQQAMPLTAPRSLTPNEVYAMVAWILFRNGIIAEDAVLDARTLPTIRMPNREGFGPDLRPDVAGS